MASIRLQNVTKTYEDGVTVIDRLNLEIRDKEFLILVGPSGCGKSTTLRMIAGLEKISEGELYIGDRPVKDVPPKDRDIAMVFQSYALYPHMSVYRNMAFALELRRVPRAEIDRRVKEAAEVLELTPYLHRKPKALSGGQRQRVALGRAMVRHPSVFLLDEPLSNLDAKLRTQMRSEITRLHERLGVTFVYVTHDQTEAMTMADRIVVMQGGKIMQMDTPAQLYLHPSNRFVAGFIGTPPMNFLSLTVKRRGDRLFLTGQQLCLSVPERMQGALQDHVDRRVTLGLRAEHITPAHAGEQAGENILRLPLEHSELMGSFTHLYLSYPDGRLLASVPSHLAPAARGAQVAVVFQMEHAHIFSPEDGALIVD